MNRTEQVGGDKWRFYTEDPDALAKYISAWAEAQHLTFSELNIAGASLEDIFVTLMEGKAHAP